MLYKKNDYIKLYMYTVPHLDILRPGGKKKIGAP